MHEISASDYVDGIEGALRDVIHAAGGPKSIGPRLWPELCPERSARRLMDCLNVDRREMLSPAQVILLMRIGRQVGCHAAINFAAEEAGYSAPLPLESDGEVARMQREFVDAVGRLAQMAERIESAQRSVSGVRRVA